MPWKLKPTSNLERENDCLRTTIVCLRRELENKQGAVGRLELLLHERLNKIDELNGKLEQSREQVRRLGLENELLAAMVAAPPRQESDCSLEVTSLRSGSQSDFAAQSDAAMLVPK
jgi:predicted RNase H-like nuclease (RuvC/YqgF family)